ncbi:MAG TPA: RDD family protein [Candidatus Dormibacteraeota bacterium]|nr:RDD family protein [Candidatus Dormibacteraeota bacterium]
MADSFATPTSPLSAARSLPSWERLAAAVIDFLVLAVPEVILFMVIAGHKFSQIFSYEVAHRSEGSAKLAKDPHFVKLADQFTVVVFHVAIVAAAITLIYLTGMYLGKGATLGKLALGLRVTRVDGRPMTVRDAVLRSLVFWIGNPFLPVIGIWVWLFQYIGGTLVLLFRGDHRGPEDLLGGTIVVRKDAQGRSLAELTGSGPPSVPPLQPPAAPPLRGGHLPGWGPVADQPPPPPESEAGEAPN